MKNVREHWPESSRTAGATSGCRCNRGAAAEVDANRGAAAEVDTIRGVVEADTIGEQQLKWTQSGSSSSAQRALQRRTTQVAERAKLLIILYTCI